MNKQEVISKLKSAIPKNKTDDYQRGEAAGLNFALLLLAEFDEPEKPVVPRFIADYIDSEQKSCSTLSEAIDNMYYKQIITDWCYINSETFAKAWLYGYEVEE